jgi:hypothetical protein
MADAPQTDWTASPATESEPESPGAVAAASDAFDERPELFVGAAFVGGFVVAQILKKVGE